MEFSTTLLILGEGTSLKGIMHSLPLEAHVMERRGGTHAPRLAWQGRRRACTTYTSNGVDSLYIFCILGTTVPSLNGVER